MRAEEGRKIIKLTGHRGSRRLPAKVYTSLTFWTQVAHLLFSSLEALHRVKCLIFKPPKFWLFLMHIKFIIRARHNVNGIIEVNFLDENRLLSCCWKSNGHAKYRGVIVVVFFLGQANRAHPRFAPSFCVPELLPAAHGLESFETVLNIIVGSYFVNGWEAEESMSWSSHCLQVILAHQLCIVFLLLYLLVDQSFLIKGPLEQFNPVTGLLKFAQEWKFVRIFTSGSGLVAISAH